MGKEPGTLFIVATPIGNLSDMTLRAIETLKNVDIIACEDTRVSGNLLKHFEIKKPLISLYQHSSGEVISKLVDQLISGKNIAYISDNGTPGISDPGMALVKAIKDTNSKKQDTNNNQIPNIKVVPIPGPSALTAAISVSGMVEKEFHFVGFLPKKKGRQTTLKWLELLNCPIVIYESAFRIEKTLGDIKTYFGKDAKVFIAREMTKMFEEYWGGSVDEVLETLSEHTIKGEFVVIVQPQKLEKVKVNKYAKNKS